MLLGAAKLLQHQQALLPDGLPGTVKLVFQPDEEYGAGGDVIIKHGMRRSGSTDLPLGLEGSAALLSQLGPRTLELRGCPLGRCA